MGTESTHWTAQFLEFIWLCGFAHVFQQVNDPCQHGANFSKNTKCFLAAIAGFVTQRLAQLIAGDGPGRPDYVVAIGPMAMMRAVAETTRGPKVKTLVSMDPLMVDGTGMCGGCRVNVGGKAQFACVDGPCFDAHEVDFDVAMRRNKAYVKEEKQALDRGHRFPPRG